MKLVLHLDESEIISIVNSSLQQSGGGEGGDGSIASSITKKLMEHFENKLDVEMHITSQEGGGDTDEVGSVDTTDSTTDNSTETSNKNSNTNQNISAATPEIFEPVFGVDASFAPVNGKNNTATDTTTEAATDSATEPTTDTTTEPATDTTTEAATDTATKPADTSTNNKQEVISGFSNETCHQCGGKKKTMKNQRLSHHKSKKNNRQFGGEQQQNDDISKTNDNGEFGCRQPKWSENCA